MMATGAFAGDVKAVPALALDRYLGKWFEIARLPNRFERGCAGVTAEYQLRDDGKIRVLNSCRKGGVNGPVKVAEGQAKQVGPAKLKVTFTPWLPFIQGNYWVLYIDKGYSLAVVGEPKRKFAWILSRSPEISSAQLAAAYGALRDNGYDPSLLEMVVQK